jgi:hypothetical protein
MKVAKGGYYPLTSSRSAYSNHACVAFEASGTTASTIFIERTSGSLTIKQGTSVSNATVKGTYTKEAFPSLVIPY